MQLHDGYLKTCKDHSHNKKLQMYINVISSVYDPEGEQVIGLTSFYHLRNALEIPVLTSEVNITINQLIQSGR